MEVESRRVSITIVTCLSLFFGDADVVAFHFMCESWS